MEATTEKFMKGLTGKPDQMKRIAEAIAASRYSAQGPDCLNSSPEILDEERKAFMERLLENHLLDGILERALTSPKEAQLRESRLMGGLQDQCILGVAAVQDGSQAPQLGVVISGGHLKSNWFEADEHFKQNRGNQLATFFEALGGRMNFEWRGRSHWVPDTLVSRYIPSRGFTEKNYFPGGTSNTALGFTLESGAETQRVYTSADGYGYVPAIFHPLAPYYGEDATRIVRPPFRNVQVDSGSKSAH